MTFGHSENDKKHANVDKRSGSSGGDGGSLIHTIYESNELFEYLNILMRV